MTARELIDAVEAERARMGLTVQELAIRAGVTEYTWQRVKSGRGGMHFYTANAMAEAVGLEIVLRRKEEP